MYSSSPACIPPSISPTEYGYQMHLRLFFISPVAAVAIIIIILIYYSSSRPDSSILSSFFSVNYWLLAGEGSVSTQSSLKSLSPSEVKQRNALVKWIEVHFSILSYFIF